MWPPCLKYIIYDKKVHEKLTESREKAIIQSMKLYCESSEKEWKNDENSNYCRWHQWKTVFSWYCMHSVIPYCRISFIPGRSIVSKWARFPLLQREVNLRQRWCLVSFSSENGRRCFLSEGWCWRYSPYRFSVLRKKSSRCRVGSRAETAVRKCCKKNAQPLAIWLTVGVKYSNITHVRCCSSVGRAPHW